MTSSGQRPLPAQPADLQRGLEPALHPGLEQRLLADAFEVGVALVHPAQEFDRISRSGHEVTVPKRTRIELHPKLSVPERILDTKQTQALADIREWLT